MGLQYKFGRDSTLAHAAVLNEKYPDVISVLAIFGCELDTKDKDGRSPIVLTIDNDQYMHVAELLKNGIDPNDSLWGDITVYQACKDIVLRDQPDHQTCLTIVKAGDVK